MAGHCPDFEFDLSNLVSVIGKAMRIPEICNLIERLRMRDACDSFFIFSIAISFLLIHVSCAQDQRDVIGFMN